MVAPSMLGGVRFAGGWVFDRVAAGWDVTVLTADGTGSRALRILGARGLDLEMALNARVRGPRPRALALDAALYESDEQIRRRLIGVLDSGMDIRLWGGRAPAAHADEIPGCVHHRLSNAARAFKAHALAARDASAGRVPRSASPRTASPANCAPAPADVVPVPAPAGTASADPAERPTETFWPAETLRPSGMRIA
ncbi:hypothetical protein BJF79_37205 [Actinomadura sp. CNU-125]|uniref:hypothetical protein n=1 Tax=Actinomadura sp. CNU-125 TaxID=1904961 RepID=UPI000967A341|nr:hypothetical protein [Actinomadura sp. CNU-125]OLT31417.1 hypothetical protein BJF79_37205 [Actinomadura sp. CNU-125]